ncbi:MAG: Hsp33 family molecular chaperone [Hyphomicrobiales bacterium]|nr:Hsp33 family molecular chaperone [Hyphomicrobiales bacterium]
MNPAVERPERLISDAPVDDSALPFAVEPLDVRGRLVRLGPALDAILARHAYPEPVSRLLAEAAVLTTMLGTALKARGRLQLQTRSDGPVHMLVVDFDAPDRLRAYAQFDSDRLAAQDDTSGAALLGRGHLALTIDHGDAASRWQGVVALDGQGLSAAAHHYFAQSEQIPTFVKLAVGELLTAEGRHWRAGGLMVQHLPSHPTRMADLDPGDAPAGFVADVADDNEPWNEALALAGTVGDDELVEPGLSGERLLYRLFHERGVKVFPAQGVRDQCRCTQEGVEAMLRGFSAGERAEMVNADGRIDVTCAFCSTLRVFDPADFA